MIRLLMTAVIAIGFISTAEAASTPQSILKDAELLNVETARDAALARLKKYPEAEVVQAFTEGLNSGEPGATTVARASAALEFKAMVPKFLAFAERHSNWHVYAALAFLASDRDRSQIEKLFIDRLAKADSEYKTLFLETLSKWKTALPRERFDQLSTDESVDVRYSLVREFLASREKYPNDDQVHRMSVALALNPYQARLQAWEEYARMPASEQAKLKSAVSMALCKKEPFQQVKAVCSKITRRAK